MTSDDTVLLFRWCLTHNTFHYYLLQKNKTKLLAYTTSNNKFPALMLSRECGLTYKEVASWISGFHREVAEKYVFLSCYAAVMIISYRRFGTNYRSQPRGSRILIHGDWIDKLSRNVSKKLPLIAA